MRVVALVLGILGAVFGFFGAVLAEGVGGLGSALGVAHAHELVGLGVLAFAAAIVGLVGAILAMSAPKASWIMLLIAAVLVVVAISAFAVPAALLFLVAMVFAILEDRRRRQATGTNLPS
jgi:hypothetical protein